MICPFCHQSFTSPPALSRTDNQTPCCPRCGTREALEAAGFKPAVIEQMLQSMYGNGVGHVLPSKQEGDT